MCFFKTTSSKCGPIHSIEGILVNFISCYRNKTVSLVGHPLFWKFDFFRMTFVFHELTKIEKFTAPLKYAGILTPIRIYHIGCIIKGLTPVSVHEEILGKNGPPHAFLLFLGYFSNIIIANCTVLKLSQGTEFFSRFFFHHCTSVFRCFDGFGDKKVFSAHPNGVWNKKCLFSLI